MNLRLGIATLLLFGFPCILCGKCSDIYGPYDESSLRESTRDEKIPFNGWKIPKINRINGKGIPIVEKKECPELFQRYSTDHTYCKESTCDIITGGVSEEDKNLILDIHNTLRSKLASGNEDRYQKLPSAANMLEMSWDDDLAEVAQAFTNLCKFEHDRADQRAVESFSVGQNLLQSSSPDKDWNSSQGWYKEEVCFFFPQYIDPFLFQEDFGHFTQLTWAKTWKVGCGFTAYQNGGETKTLYACNYGPAGNGDQVAQYIVGEPCSQCPKNTECSTRYPGLCKPLTEDGPQVERPSPDKYILFCEFNDNDPEECNNVKVEGSQSFTTRHIYSGNYKTVVLQGGETITIDLGKAQNKGGFCPFLYSRFGPNNAKDAAGSVVEILFTSPDTIPQPPTKIYPNGPDFSIVGLHMMYDGELKTTVTLRAEEGADPQYFDIKYWGIRRGACKNDF